MNKEPKYQRNRFQLFLRNNEYYTWIKSRQADNNERKNRTKKFERIKTEIDQVSKDLNDNEIMKPLF